MLGWSRTDIPFMPVFLFVDYIWSDQQRLAEAEQTFHSCLCFYLKVTSGVIKPRLAEAEQTFHSCLCFYLKVTSGVIKQRLAEAEQTFHSCLCFYL